MNKVGEITVKQRFPDKAFVGLTFDVTKTKGSVLETYPQLADIRSWKNYKKADADKVMKFIVFMFDPETPLKNKITVAEERRHVAAVLSGWQQRDAGYEKITKLEDPDHLEMVADYLAYVGNRDWTMLVVAEILFDRLTKTTLTGDIKTASSTPEVMEDLSKRIDTYYDKMFKDKDIARQIRRGKISAEKIARQTSVQED